MHRIDKKMKYKRLTKEQLEALHQEFASFLAAQSIDKKQWDDTKQNNPNVAEEQIDVFSDLVWEGVLTKANYLEHFSKNHIFLFACFEKEVKTIVLKSLYKEVDFLKTEGLQWLSDHLFTEKIEMRLGTKVFETHRNTSLFALIEQGAILSDGQLYQQINSIITS